MIISIQKEKAHLFIKSLPLLLLLAFVTDALSPTFYIKDTLMSLDLYEITTVQGSGDLFKQLYFVLLLFFSIYMYMTCGQENRPKQVTTSTLMLIFIFLLMIVSVMWSDYPILTVKRIIFQSMLTMIIYLSILTIGSVSRVMETLYFYFFGLAIYVTLFAILLPHFSFDVGGELSSIYKGKNYLGFVAFIGSTISLYFFNLEKENSGKVLALWLIILLLSQSKTCIAVMVMVFLYNLVSRNHVLLNLTTRLFLFAVALIFIIIPTITYFYSSVSFFSIYGGFFGTIDLTGRGEIWQLSIEQINSHPFFGVGYASFWGTGTVPDVFNVQYRFFQFINQSHNGYIDVLIQLGVVGLIMVITMLTSLWKELILSKNIFLINVFFFCIIHNVTESSLIRDSHLVWCMVLIILATIYLDNNNETRKAIIE